VAHRCYVSPEAFSEATITIEGEEAHHLLHVLRLRERDALEVFNGLGGRAFGEIRTVERSRLQLTVQDRQQDPPPELRITLAPCLIKNHRLEWLLQKAVEIGVTGITLVQSDHCVIQTREWKGGKRRERLQRIIISAARQSGRSWLPTFDGPLPLASFLAERPEGPCLLADLGEGSLPLSEVLAQHPNATEWTALVGPEGDFSEEERIACKENGTLSVGLGAQVLRSETASLYLLSILHHLGTSNLLTTDVAD
jgi:16S rRNA (uracil1498-N3)-methyltransferase